MRAMGFRAEKDTIHFGVVEGTKDSPILVADDKFSAPRTYSDAQSMGFFRDRLLTLVEQYKPSAAFIRYSETFLAHKPSPAALGSMFARARIEGVILEAVHSAGVQIVGASWAGIKSELGSKKPKAYLEAGEIRGVDITGRPPPRQEAIMVAVAALEK